MNLLLIVLLPFAGALLPPLAGRLGRGAAAWAAAIVPALALLLSLEPLLAAFAGTPLTVSRAWLPQAGFDLILRMDGLAGLFILLILGIGLLIILYANYYLSEDDGDIIRAHPALHPGAHSHPGRRVHQIGAVPLPLLAAKGHGRANPHQRLSALGHHGQSGRLPAGRLYPVLSGTDLWFFSVSGVGLTTLVMGAYAAIFQHDLKGLLAYSTISHLGLIVLLFGWTRPWPPWPAFFTSSTTPPSRPRCSWPPASSTTKPEPGTCGA
jgi:hypothetical protein